MKNKDIFKKITRHILRSNKGIELPKFIYPAREWGLGVIASVIIFGVIGFWSTQTYDSYRHTPTKNNSEESVSVVYRENMVQSALLEFSNKSKKHMELLEELSYEKVEKMIEVVELIDVATSSLAETSSTSADFVNNDFSEVLEDDSETIVSEEVEEFTTVSN